MVTDPALMGTEKALVLLVLLASSWKCRIFFISIFLQQLEIVLLVTKKL